MFAVSIMDLFSYINVLMVIIHYCAYVGGAGTGLVFIVSVLLSKLFDNIDPYEYVYNKCEYMNSM